MGELAALSAAAFWAFASLIFAQLGKDVGAIALNVLKCVIALVLMLITLAILDGRVWPVDLSTADAIYLAISGFIGLTVGDTAYFYALVRLGPRRALLFTSLVPPTTALLAIPTLGEPFTLAMILGMGLTMGGVVWVILERTDEAEGEGDGKLDKKELAGIAFALVAVACQAGGNVLTKLGGESTSALEISIVRLAAGVLGLALVLLVTRNLKDLVKPFETRASTVKIVVATLAGTYLGIWLLNAGLKYTYVGIASTLSSTSPIWILPLAYFVLGEKLSMRAILGACIAVAGVAILFLV